MLAQCMVCPGLVQWTSCVLLALLLGSSASAQGSRQYVVELNRQAMEAYTNLDVYGAENLLNQALQAAQRGGVQGTPLARTYLNLGVVAVGGHQDNAQAIQHFQEALRIDPSIRLDPMTSTPDVQAAFGLAQASRRGSSPGYMASTTSRANPQWYERAPEAPRSPGKLGDSCRRGTDCRAGLMCSDRVCLFDDGSGGDDAKNDGKDEEHEDDEESGDEEPPRFFLRVGAAAGVGLANGKMWADRDPSGDGQGAVAYVPSGQNGCSAPQNNFCVRVERTGFLPTLAMRATLGYYVTERVALAGTLRYQFDAGRGSMANMLIGVRLAYLATTPTVEGLAVAPFLGGSYGQIQLHPSQGDIPARDQPYTMSGLTGVQLGSSITYRFSRAFGIHITPEVHIHFPAFLLAAEVTAGLEIGL